MTYTVFYSWQSDTSSKDGRNFIEHALGDAIKRILADSEIEEADRDLALDKDTKGVPGSPRIFETILSKIDRASALVADLTFCCTRPGGDPSPNPNVLVEYGYALKSLGENYIISVMNAAHGAPSRQNMPFDLLNRKWPITYNLPDGASDSDRREARKQLSEVLEKALTNIFESEDFKAKRQPSIPALPQFAPRVPLAGQARFRREGEPLGVATWHPIEVYLDNGPAMWLRLLPGSPPERPFLLGELEEKTRLIAFANLIDFGPGNIGVFKSGDCCGCFPSRVEHNGRVDVPSAATMFETGELWTVMAFPTYFNSKVIPFEERGYISCLDLFSQALEKSGFSRPFRWVAGIEGVRGWHLPNQSVLMPARGTCLVDEVVCDGDLVAGQSSKDSIKPFFQQLYDKCGTEWPGAAS
jgi:hypothetical protein